MYLYLILKISLNLYYVLFISIYQYIMQLSRIENSFSLLLFLLLLHILLALTPFKNEKLLYLSGQTICRIGDDWKWDFGRASRILSLFLCSSDSRKSKSSVCGNNNTRQWNRTHSRKRTNCRDNNYSRN